MSFTECCVRYYETFVLNSPPPPNLDLPLPGFTYIIYMAPYKGTLHDGMRPYKLQKAMFNPKVTRLAK